MHGRVCPRPCTRCSAAVPKPPAPRSPCKSRKPLPRTLPPAARSAGSPCPRAAPAGSTPPAAPAGTPQAGTGRRSLGGRVVREGQGPRSSQVSTIPRASIRHLDARVPPAAVQAVPATTSVPQNPTFPGGQHLASGAAQQRPQHGTPRWGTSPALRRHSPGPARPHTSLDTVAAPHPRQPARCPAPPAPPALCQGNWHPGCPSSTSFPAPRARTQHTDIHTPPCPEAYCRRPCPEPARRSGVAV